MLFFADISIILMLQRYDSFFTYSKLCLLFIFDRPIIKLNISFAHVCYSLQGAVKGMPRCKMKTVDNKKATAGRSPHLPWLPSLKINLAVPIICRIFANRIRCKNHGQIGIYTTIYPFRVPRRQRQESTAYTRCATR